MFDDAAPAPVPTFSNVHAAVEWAAAHGRTGPDETLTTKSMTPRRSENISCDLLKTLLAKSIVA
jgi:hypothetical protein